VNSGEICARTEAENKVKMFSGISNSSNWRLSSLSPAYYVKALDPPSKGRIWGKEVCEL